jgi:hypothetical protein
MAKGMRQEIIIQRNSKRITTKLIGLKRKNSYSFFLQVNIVLCNHSYEVFFHRSNSRFTDNSIILYCL